MKKWFALWMVVAAILYGVYSYTVDAAEKFNTDIGVTIERVAGRRND